MKNVAWIKACRIMLGPTITFSYLLWTSVSSCVKTLSFRSSSYSCIMVVCWHTFPLHPISNVEQLRVFEGFYFNISMILHGAVNKITAEIVFDLCSWSECWWLHSCWDVTCSLSFALRSKVFLSFFFYFVNITFLFEASSSLLVLHCTLPD